MNLVGIIPAAFLALRVALCVCLIGVIGVSGSRAGESDGDMTRIDFSRDNEAAHWELVNDSVMGGVSRSEMRIADDGIAVFEGTVSLENNGGFAMARTKPGDYAMAGFDGMAIRVRGDGKTYKLRLRTDKRFDGIAYSATFETRAGEWETIHIPFLDFVPTFRGRVLTDVEPLDPVRIRRIGLMIADKQAGAFRLEIDWIAGVHLDKEL